MAPAMAMAFPGVAVAGGLGGTEREKRLLILPAVQSALVNRATGGDATMYNRCAWSRLASPLAESIGQAGGKGGR